MGELKERIASLKDDYRLPFLMHYEGYSYIEIGEELDLNIGTVKSRIFYARKQLKERILADYGETRLRAA